MQDIIENPSEEMETKDYKKIVGLLKKGSQGVLISGGAGTGKSTFIEYMCSEQARKEFSPAEHMMMIAPTGVAAMRIGGATVHSTFKFPPEIFDYREGAFIGGEEVSAMESKKRLFTETSLLIIDEVSMLRADLMDAINLSMQLHRGVREPFGGVRILFVGDIFQLQPVITRTDRELLDDIYPKGTDMFFFESLVFQEMLDRDRVAFFELKIPYRYEATKEKVRNPGEFPKMLNSIRRGDGRYLNDLNRHLARPQHWKSLLEAGAVMLTGRRESAEEYNTRKLEALPDEEREFVGRAEGKCVNYDDKRLPAPHNLCLKKGAQVIFLRNDPLGRWQNGSQGYVEDFGYDEDKEAEYLRIRSGRGKSAEMCKVFRESWEIYSYKFDDATRKILREEEGRYEQFPLMLAWALTIHRAQGQTLDSVVVNLQNGAFSKGQVYVAISRCRLAKNLGLMHPLRENDVRCHPAVTKFYDIIAKEE